jgi:hypothetical protein
VDVDADVDVDVDVNVDMNVDMNRDMYMDMDMAMDMDMDMKINGLVALKLSILPTYLFHYFRIKDLDFDRFIAVQFKWPEENLLMISTSYLWILKVRFVAFTDSFFSGKLTFEDRCLPLFKNNLSVVKVPSRLSFSP